MTPVNQPEDPRAKAALIARESYGRLVAILASRTSDIAAAEDVLADAFAKAMEKWPVEGIPQNPEGWLITVATNRVKDIAKSSHSRTYAGSLEDVDMPPSDSSGLNNLNPDEIPDERLRLMFACAHPALTSSIHTPLMMQTVLGFEAADIASAYLMPSATLAQRLVRAKRKIKDAGIPFTLPERADMTPRLTAVLEAVYGAYALNWDQQELDRTKDIASEATYLASVIADLLPEEPEALGLAALLAFSLARRIARQDQNSDFVPLEEQDTARWDRMLIRRGNVLLERAVKLGSPARFQLEALIQSLHMSRATTGQTDWAQIVQVYDALIQIAPTTGAAIARAAALGKAHGPEAGLRALDIVHQLANDADLNRMQPYWATKSHLLRQAGKASDAREAYEKAISLTTDSAVRSWLEKEMGR
ncbi:ECF family RNA polymerase sigma factor [Roseibium sp. TrichSKD4]|uniref:RNA polymerase sigma factor n=1 Tax=Roseibium sp. TrichSKD4 TaxID=744980 RepID=UPI0001E56B6F|nr:DUF6596 domain-containing protein [Roseibium sp. TrichSKD4]EFO30709.1 ECF family RNA polymerase sigma factor [Roseibium sp. TrichSKD4]